MDHSERYRIFLLNELDFLVLFAADALDGQFDEQMLCRQLLDLVRLFNDYPQSITPDERKKLIHFFGNWAAVVKLRLGQELADLRALRQNGGGNAQAGGASPVGL